MAPGLPALVSNCLAGSPEAIGDYMHKGSRHDGEGTVHHALNWLVIVVVISWFVLFGIECVKSIQR